MKELLIVMVLVVVTLQFSLSQRPISKQPTTNSPKNDVKLVQNEPKIEEDTYNTSVKTVVLSSKKVIIIEPKNEEINIVVSFYTNSKSDCGKTNGVSASGKHLPTLSRGGTIPIAAPKDIPFNTKIYIDGIGECDVQDRGGLIKWVWIDGVKYMKVDLFVPNTTDKKLKEMGIVKTTGHIIK